MKIINTICDCLEDAMRRHFAFLFMLCLGFNGLAYAEETCGDDARLKELPVMLERGELPASPLTLTPNTFLRLQPDIRKALGKAIVVCPGIPLLKSGKPALKIEMNFLDIQEVLEMNAASQNWEEVAYVLDSFKAKPMEPLAIFSLLFLPNLGDKSLNSLAKVLKFHPVIQNGPIFWTDIFKIFGGKTTRPLTICWSYSDRELAEARSKGDHLKLKDVVFTLYSGYWREAATSSLKALEIDLVEARDFFRSLNH